IGGEIDQNLPDARRRSLDLNVGEHSSAEERSARLPEGGKRGGLGSGDEPPRRPVHGRLPDPGGRDQGGQIESIVRIAETAKLFGPRVQERNGSFRQAALDLVKSRRHLDEAVKKELAISS